MQEICVSNIYIINDHKCDRPIPLHVSEFFKGVVLCD